MVQISHRGGKPRLVAAPSSEDLLGRTECQLVLETLIEGDRIVSNGGVITELVPLNKSPAIIASWQ